MTMKRNFRDPHIIYPSSEPSHHCSIEVGIVLVLLLINKIEVPDYQPWPRALDSEIPQLLKKLDLVLILLGAIYTGQPPRTTIRRAELDRDTVSIHPGSSNSAQLESPSHQNSTTGPIRRKVNKIIIKITS